MLGICRWKFNTTKVLFFACLCSLIISFVRFNLIVTKNILKTTKLPSPKEKAALTVSITVAHKDDLPVPFTFDTTYYNGPIIEGWPPTRNRSLHLYINQAIKKTLLPLSCLDLTSEEVHVMILVQSAPEFFERRESIRKTWMQHIRTDYKVRTLFVFGTNGYEKKTSLMEEQKVNCDIIQFNFVDHYNNATLDSLMALRFLIDQEWTHPPKFIMIVDDDVYINIPALYWKLFDNPYPSITETGDSLLGFQQHMTAVHFPDAEFANLQYVPYDKSRTYCPKYMYNRVNYPPYISGGGYVIPFHLCQCLYQKAMKLPYFHINDVFITGFARQSCHFKLAHDLDFCQKYVHDMTGTPVLFHQVNEEEKHKIHLLLQNMKIAKGIHKNQSVTDL